MQRLREIPAVRMIMKSVIYYLTKGHSDVVVLSAAVSTPSNMLIPVGVGIDR